MAGPISAGNLSVGDPRLSVSGGVDDIGTRQDSIIHHLGPPDTHGHNTVYLDSSITFETYHWWAQRAREYEKDIPANAGYTGFFNVLVGRMEKEKTQLPADASGGNAGELKDGTEEVAMPKDDSVEKKADADVIDSPSHGSTKDEYGVAPAEWERAQRAARTASWGAIFYLITTDILGPFSIPWAIAQLGYGPGIAIFVVFGGLAYYSSMQLWRMFIGLDSPRYPIRNYGDVAFRLFGNWARVLANFLQSFQFFLSVALCIVANGQGLAQMAVGRNGNGFLCFVVAELVFTLIGFILGQIRTLQRFGFLANVSVWLNVTIILSTVVAVFTYAPNYPAAHKEKIFGPIQPTGGVPPGKTLADNVQGMMNGVFAYGGATMFNEFMAEMRRPWDFWKALLIAETFITVIYLVFGLLVYSQQGQYVFNPTFQGITGVGNGYNLQTLGNAIYFVVSVIAALLYGNIGIKVFYAAVLRDAFKFPPLDSKKGKLTWAALIPIYWTLAFILAAAVPQVSQLTAFEGATTIMQFTYTFPPILMVAYNCQKDSVLLEEKDTFDPYTGEVRRVDSGFKRYWRGFKKQFVLNSWDSVYGLAALAASILGIWSSIVGMIAAYKGASITPFTCVNPAG